MTGVTAARADGPAPLAGLAAIPDSLGLSAAPLGLLAVVLGVLDFLDFPSGASASAAGTAASAGVARRFSGSSADLMTRAYVSVIRFSRSAV
jgi:hypothetical protein